MKFKKKHKFTTLVAIIGIILSLFTGCKGAATGEKLVSNDLEKYELDNFEKEFNANDKVKYVSNNNKNVVIGFSMDSLKEGIWKKHKDIFTNKAQELGAEVKIEVANSDDRLQLSQIDKLIAEGVNVLVIAPHDGEVIAESVQKAHDAGIKVISYDRLIKNSDIDLYISFDNVKVGELQAAEILKKVPSGNIAYVGGSQTDNNAVLFRQGAMNIVEQNKGKVNVVMDQYSADWKADEAFKNVTSLLEKRQDIGGIIAANDGTASGSIAALEKFRLAGKVFVTGQDADLLACQRIVEGKQLMTIYKPAKVLAEKAVELAIDLANGGNAEVNNKVFNGKIDAPSYLIEPIVVNKENMMDTIIKDDFNRYEDVYRNIPEDKRPKQ
ncbi:MAG: sugar ABC transporter substrate-binding protein [Clostridiaceae bacterium]